MINTWPDIRGSVRYGCVYVPNVSQKRCVLGNINIYRQKVCGNYRWDYLKNNANL